MFPLSCTWRGGRRAGGRVVGRGVGRRRNKKQKKPGGGPGGRGPSAESRSGLALAGLLRPAVRLRLELLRNEITTERPRVPKDGWRVLAVGDMGFGRSEWLVPPAQGPRSPRAQLHLFYFPSRATPHARRTTRAAKRQGQGCVALHDGQRKWLAGQVSRAAQPLLPKACLPRYHPSQQARTAEGIDCQAITTIPTTAGVAMTD